MPLIAYRGKKETEGCSTVANQTILLDGSLPDQLYMLQGDTLSLFFSTVEKNCESCMLLMNHYLLSLSNNVIAHYICSFLC